MATALKHLLLERRREWLTMAQLAEHGPFPTAEAARKWVLRHAKRCGFPYARQGERKIIVDRDTYDRHVLEHGLKRSA